MFFSCSAARLASTPTPPLPPRQYRGVPGRWPTRGNMSVIDFIDYSASMKRLNSV
jgi:hypothetical protein